MGYLKHLSVSRLEEYLSKTFDTKVKKEGSGDLVVDPHVERRIREQYFEQLCYD